MSQLTSRKPSKNQVVVEEVLRCPECGSEHIVRDYAAAKSSVIRVAWSSAKARSMRVRMDRL